MAQPRAELEVSRPAHSGDIAQRLQIAVAELFVDGPPKASSVFATSSASFIRERVGLRTKLRELCPDSGIVAHHVDGDDARCLGE